MILYSDPCQPNPEYQPPHGQPESKFRFLDSFRELS
nr:MAG TPA: hypothetical protein [Caudoviricetes sp.]